MPFTVDQPFWANRLYTKGYSIKPLREKDLKITDLANALKEMENKKYIEEVHEGFRS